MLKEVIGVGDTELEALNDAKKQLGLDETDDVEFELIQRAEKKMFGLFGGAPAKVRIIIKDTPEEKAEKFLREVLDKMQLSSVEVEKKSEEGAVEFNLSGEDVGFVIGRRGETLDALQYLTSLVANHSEDPYIKVTVNTGNYREKREKTLESLGRKLAFKAIKTGKLGARERERQDTLLSVPTQRLRVTARADITTTAEAVQDVPTIQTTAQKARL